MYVKYFKKQTITIVIAIFLIALLPRLLSAFHSTSVPVLDSVGYDGFALDILEGKGLVNERGEPTSWREPFYPLFLASIYYVFGHSYLAVRLVQAILGALTCVVIYLLANRTFGLKIGLISASIACFNPTFIRLSEYLLTENLFIFLLAVATLLLSIQIREKGYKNLVFLGVILGLATLTRSVTLLFPLFIVVFMGKSIVSQNSTTKKYFLSIIIFIFSFSLTIAPWTLRNWRAHHRFVPIVSRTGLGLYTSYVPREGKLFGFNAQDEITRKSELINSEVERSDFLVKETIKYIRNNPGRILKLEILKMFFFWCPFDWGIIGEGVYNFMYGFILPFFVLGIFITFKGFRKLLPVYLPIIYLFFFALVTFGMPRFRLPAEPYIIIIAAAGISYFFHRFSKKLYSFLLIGSYFLLNLLLYFNSYQIKAFTTSALGRVHLW